MYRRTGEMNASISAARQRGGIDRPGGRIPGGFYGAFGLEDVLENSHRRSLIWAYAPGR